jgi:hypothetical protein
MTGYIASAASGATVALLYVVLVLARRASVRTVLLTLAKMATGIVVAVLAYALTAGVNSFWSSDIPRGLACGLFGPAMLQVTLGRWSVPGLSLVGPKLDGAIRRSVQSEGSWHRRRDARLLGRAYLPTTIVELYVDHILDCGMSENQAQIRRGDLRILEDDVVPNWRQIGPILANVARFPIDGFDYDDWVLSLRAHAYRRALANRIRALLHIAPRLFSPEDVALK